MNKKPVLLIVQSVLCVLTAILLIAADLMIYFQGLDNRSEDPMADIYTVEAIGGKAVFVLPILLISVIVTIICLTLKIKDAGADRPVNVPYIKKNGDDNGPAPSTVKAVRWILLAVAVILIIVGIFNGSLSDVFVKAAKICTECIGLG